MNTGRETPKALEGGWLRSGLILAAWILLWGLVQGLFGAQGMALRAQLMAWLAALAALCGAGLLMGRERLARCLTSQRFVILLAGVAAVSLFLGLLAEPARRPSGLAWLQCSQLPRRLWFLSLIFLLAASMAIQAWEQRSSRPARWGFLMAHGALALILAGALWNAIGGLRIPLELGPGDSAQIAPDLTLRLASFKAELPDPEFRLYAYVVPNGKGGFETRPKAYPVREGFAATLPGTSLRMDMERLIPNAVDAGQWVENPKAQPNPALRVLLGLGLPDPPSGILLAKGGRDSRIDEPLGRFAVLFRDSWNDAIPATLGPKAPTREKLVLDLGGRSFERDLLEPGTWAVEDLAFQVKGRFPDFAIRRDAEGNSQPYSASSRARDPWVQLELARRDGRVWKLLLSARNPEVTDRLNQPSLPEGARLRYVREGEDPQERFVVFTHDDRKVSLVEGGRLVRQEACVMDRPFVLERGLSITPVALLEKAEFKPEFRPHPDPAQAQRFVHPALSVKLTDPSTGRCESRWLEALGPDDSFSGASFLDGRVGLLFKPMDLEPRNLRSEIGILDGQGQEVLRSMASLGEPMRHGSLEIHQAGWRPGEARCSRLLVLREPGRGLVNFGLWLLLAGALWMFGLEPRLERRPEP